jgi:hypothetical protein
VSYLFNKRNIGNKSFAERIFDIIFEVYEEEQRIIYALISATKSVSYKLKIYRTPFRTSVENGNCSKRYTHGARNLQKNSDSFMPNGTIGKLHCTMKDKDSNPTLMYTPIDSARRDE